jgi:hypothetical protein
MDSVDLRILQQGVIVAGSTLDANRFAELPRRLIGEIGNRYNFNVAQPSNVLGVDFAHETSADQGGLYLFHNEFDPLCR